MFSTFPYHYCYDYDDCHPYSTMKGGVLDEDPFRGNLSDF